MKQIQYPTTIKRLFVTLEEVCTYGSGLIHARLMRLLEGANLPDDTRFFDQDIIFNDELTGIQFHILLPTGEIFTGMSFWKPGDGYNDVEGVLIAAERAVATYKAARRLKEPKVFIRLNSPAAPSFDDIIRAIERGVRWPTHGLRFL